MPATPQETLRREITPTSSATPSSRILTPVSVKWFGAVGDGVSDDTVPIQDANDYVESTGSPGVIYFPKGIYDISILNLGVNVSFFGDGVNSTRIRMRSGSNSASVVQTKGFSTLTGTTSLGGSFRNYIRDVTIDGYKSLNSSGRGIQIYGKAFFIQNVSVENCFSTGLYTEYGGSDDFSTPLKTLEAEFSNISIQQCGGSGFLFNGPHDSVARNIISFSNGLWGIEVTKSIHAISWNTFLCPSGGIHAFGDGSAIYGSDIVGSAGSGYGAWLESGGHSISSGSFGAPIGLRCDGNHNNIECIIANTTVSGFVLGATSASGNFKIMFGGGNVGFWIDASLPTSPSVVIANSDDASGTLFAPGSPPSGTYLITGAKHTLLFNSAGQGNGLTNVLNGQWTIGDLFVAGALRPPTPAGASQDAVKLYGGIGVPSNSDGSNSGLYFRADPSGANTTIYRKSAGVWSGIL